jgi:rubrerythrin
MDIRKIYEYALQREHEGKRFFEQNAERMNHAVAASTFKALADEEQKHIEFIESLLNAMDKGLPPNRELGDKMEKEGFFSKRAHSELLDQTSWILSY